MSAEAVRSASPQTGSGVPVLARDELRSLVVAWTLKMRDDGMLPEQTGERLRPECYKPWVERWGEPAVPLLWSHAMYLTLLDVLA